GLAASGNDGRCTLILRLAGSAAAVDRSLKECRVLASQTGLTLAEKGAEILRAAASVARSSKPAALVLRVAGPSAQMADIAQNLMSSDARFFAYPGLGVLY